MDISKDLHWLQWEYLSKNTFYLLQYDYIRIILILLCLCSAGGSSKHDVGPWFPKNCSEVSAENMGSVKRGTTIIGQLTSKLNRIIPAIFELWGIHRDVWRCVLLGRVSNWRISPFYEISWSWIWRKTNFYTVPWNGLPKIERTQYKSRWGSVVSVDLQQETCRTIQFFRMHRLAGL